MGKEKVLQQNSTHKAVEEDDKIWIVEKGLDLDDLKYPDQKLYSIPIENKDDLFAIFEEIEEDNRIMLNELI